MNAISLIRIIFIALWSASISLVAGFFLLIGGKKKGPELYQSFSLIWSRIILEFCGIEVEVKGLEKLKNLQGAILVSNHMSYFDTPIIVFVLKIAFRIVFKIELLKVAIFGWILGRSGNIPVDRKNPDEETYEKIEKALEQGINVVMFAEGTSGYDNKISRFKRGPFIIAYEVGAVIIPVVIKGSYFIYNKTNKKLINSGKVTVEFLDPIKDFLDEEIFFRKSLPIKEKIRATKKVKEKTRNTIVSKYWEA